MGVYANTTLIFKIRKKQENVFYKKDLVNWLLGWFTNSAKMLLNP